MKFLHARCKNIAQKAVTLCVVGLQVTAETIEQPTDDPHVFQLFMPGFFWQTFDNARETAVAIGNHVSIESGELAGGVNLGSNDVRLALLPQHDSPSFQYNIEASIAVA